MIPKKVCPFCGNDDVQVVETSTYRWRAAECSGCGARGPEVRIKTLGAGSKAEWEEDALIRALNEWNNRD